MVPAILFYVQSVSFWSFFCNDFQYNERFLRHSYAACVTWDSLSCPFNAQDTWDCLEQDISIFASASLSHCLFPVSVLCSPAFSLYSIMWITGCVVAIRPYYNTYLSSWHCDRVVIKVGHEKGFWMDFRKRTEMWKVENEQMEACKVFICWHEC